MLGAQRRHGSSNLKWTCIIPVWAAISVHTYFWGWLRKTMLWGNCVVLVKPSNCGLFSGGILQVFMKWPAVAARHMGEDVWSYIITQRGNFPQGKRCCSACRQMDSQFLKYAAVCNVSELTCLQLGHFARWVVRPNTAHGTTSITTARKEDLTLITGSP